jgi:ParB-like chromosome segregation protein Spo0J
MGWGLSIKEIAQKAGRSEGHVRNRLELANAIPAVKEAVATGEITAKDAMEIVKESDGKVDNQTEALMEKQTAPRKPRVRPLHLYFDDGKVKTKGRKKETCEPLVAILQDEDLLLRLLEAGYDPETLKISIAKAEG